MRPAVIGVIGCGNISDAYLKGAAGSKLIRVKSVADLRAEAAQAKAEAYGVKAVAVEALLADPEIEIVLNLTVPQAHVPVGLQIIAAGKHVYSEKPLAPRHAEGEALLRAAAAKGVRVGCAPDTFFGGSHQAIRRLIDAGTIGRPIGGVATVMAHGMEHWHPNPVPFYKHGGGPIHDVGPYYVTQLVNLLGPVVRVTAQASRGFETRLITSAPLNGETIAVEVPTTVNGVLSFASGANVSLSASWDVWKHKRFPFEIYGSEGSLQGPDPNFFTGTPQVTQRSGDWTDIDIAAHPFAIPNMTSRSGVHVGDYRIVGLLDMAAAVHQGRPHRASGAMALHVLEVLDAFERASVEGRHIMIASTCERPEPVPLGQGEEVFLA